MFVNYLQGEVKKIILAKYLSILWEILSAPQAIDFNGIMFMKFLKSICFRNYMVVIN